MLSFLFKSSPSVCWIMIQIVTAIDPRRLTFSWSAVNHSHHFIDFAQCIVLNSFRNIFICKYSLYSLHVEWGKHCAELNTFERGHKHVTAWSISLYFLAQVWLHYIVGVSWYPILYAHTNRSSASLIFLEDETEEAPLVESANWRVCNTLDYINCCAVALLHV